MGGKNSIKSILFNKMAGKGKQMAKRKRKLTEAEREEMRIIMENAPQGRKPDVRFFAKHFGVNQPSIVKSMGGWDGIQRNKPNTPTRVQLIDSLKESPIKLEGYTTEVDLPGEGQHE
jgi:hypothetical protein